MPATTASRSSSQASTASNYSHGGRSRSSTRSKQNSLANISVRSFSDFKAQTPKSPTSVRRKPLPPNASPQVSCFSPTETHFADVEDLTRPGSIDSNTSKQASGLTTVLASGGAGERKGQDSRKSVHAAVREQARSIPRADEKHSHEKHSSVKWTNEGILPLRTRSNGKPETQPRQRVGTASFDYPAGTSQPLQQDKGNNGLHGGRPALIRVASSISPTSKDPASFHQPLPALIGPDMSVFADGLPRSVSDNSIRSTQTISPTKQKNSPASASKFSSFFGWKASPKTGAESPSTPFTDRSGSPAASPYYPKNAPLDRSISAPRLNAPAAIDTRAANVVHGLYNDSPPVSMNPQTPNNVSCFDELERELKEVSSELASSIRREMELEDEVDRFKGDASTIPGEMTRRTSDYFSDSGSSGAKVSASDSETKIERLEKEKRRLEQEKGQIKADYSTKLASELKKRHEMEVRISLLEQDVHDGRAKAAAGADAGEKIRELETFLEETRRRLAQERQSRDNFEDLLAALRAELTQMRNDRDNLAEEIVPQLKTRIDGLESENNRILQEYGYGTPANRSRVNSVAEEGGDQPGTPWGRMGGLVRSNSVFGSNGGLRRGNSTLNRSTSVKGRSHENPEIKEIEDQRDALHKTLKNLIRRHEAQKREHARAIHRLIVDRDAALTTSPGRSNFARNVATLKEEIVTLRRRADEALTQKWQCEDSLGGVKMALDRAEQETRSLRAMLGARDENARKGSDGLGISVDGDEDPTSMIKILRRSIQLAETERDAAKREAETYRQKARTLNDRNLAEELLDSATRLDELAASLHECVEKNISLRERLAAALEKGAKEQNNSTAKVMEMQSRLKGLEDQLVSAREESENAFAQNEEAAKSIDKAATPHVKRLTLSIPGPRHTGHRDGVGIFSARSPRLDVTRSGKAESLNENTKTAVLEKRVADLEKALLEADTEMKGVVQRVEKSRGEIALLQGERDQANQGMKTLQNAISKEKQKALRLMIPA